MSSLTQIEAQLVVAIGRLQRQADLAAAERLKLTSLSSNLATVRAAIATPKSSEMARRRVRPFPSQSDA